MAKRLEKIGATHVRLETASQSLPSPTLQLERPVIDCSHPVDAINRYSLEQSALEQGEFREMF
jgi:hypothetical protein